MIITETDLLHRACPVCGNMKSRELFTKDGYHYVQCDDCTLVFINPIPNEHLLKAKYDHFGVNYFTLPAKLRIDFTPNRYKRELNILSHSNASDVLLDVGCSTGSFLVAAQQAGFQHVQGIDIAGPSIEYAQQQGLNVLAGDFTSGVYSTASFDVVTLWATLEHLPFPEKFVAEASRILRLGGLLGVSVPNNNSISSRILGSKYRYVSVEHLNYFSVATLRRLLECYDFEVQVVETRSINPFVIAQDMRGMKLNIQGQIRESEVSSRIKSSSPYNPVQWIYYVLDEMLLRLGRGDLLLMTARKK